MSSFENLRVADNFCQTSLFVPITTLVLFIPLYSVKKHKWLVA